MKVEGTVVSLQLASLEYDSEEPQDDLLKPLGFSITTCKALAPASGQWVPLKPAAVQVSLTSVFFALIHPALTSASQVYPGCFSIQPISG